MSGQKYSVNDSVLRWDYGAIGFDKTGKVEGIHHVLQYSLELQELIGARGEPDGFTVSMMPESGTSGPVSFEFLWPEQGISVVVMSSMDFKKATEQAPFGPQSLIESATYFAPFGSAEEYLLKFGGSPYYVWNGYTPLPHY